MKLVHRDLERQLVLEDMQSDEWIIESPTLFSRYVQELYIQSQGGEGGFVLSEGDKTLSIEKDVEVIINPLSVNVNEKRFLNKLYAELRETAYGESMYLKTQELLAKLQGYFSDVEQQGTYFLTTDAEIDITNVFKAMGVRVECYADNFLQTLDEYIKLLAELLRKKLIVLVNIGSYIQAEEMEQLARTAMHNEVYLLFVENQQRNFSTVFRRYIIDRDNCEI